MIRESNNISEFSISHLYTLVIIQSVFSFHLFITLRLVSLRNIYPAKYNIIIIIIARVGVTTPCMYRALTNIITIIKNYGNAALLP